MYLDIVTFATTIFVIIDDWYKKNAHRYLSGKVGQKPKFTDSEVLTLMLLQEFLPFHSERRFLNFIRGNYLFLFPKLIDQSQFNRRTRYLRLIENELRKNLAESIGAHLAALYVLDTAPVPVVGYKRPKNKRVEELEHHNAKTVLGLITRIITKVTAYVLRHVLLRFHGIDVLNFEIL